MDAASEELGKAASPPVHVAADRLTAVLEAVGRDSLERLLGECRRRLETMAGDLRRADLADHRRHVLASLHKLQGSCSSLGLQTLAEALQRIQSLVRAAGDAEIIAAGSAAATDVDDLIAATWGQLTTDARLDLRPSTHGRAHGRAHGTGDLKR